MVVYKPLFTDAELGENFAEDIVVGDFAGDCSQMVDDLADLLAQQVGREALLKCRESSLQ